MSNLPVSITLSHILNLPYPGDITLGDCKAAFLNGEIAQNIERVRQDRSRDLRIRFLQLFPEATLLENREVEFSDDTLLSVFKELAAKNLAKVAIDEGGGLRVKAPLEPV